MRILLLPTLILLLSGTLAAQQERPVMAIAPIEPDSTVTADERSQLDQAVRQAIGKKFGVQSDSMTSAHIEAAKALGIVCKENDKDCWRQVRDISTAQSMVLCKASRVEGNVQVDITIDRIGPASNDDGQVAGTITFPIGQERIDDLIARLFAVQATVVFAVAPADAELLLDGARLTERTKELSPGSYEVLASAPGYEAVSRTFEVKAGELNTVEIALERAAESVLPYALIGGGVVGIVGGVALGFIGANYVNPDGFVADDAAGSGATNADNQTLAGQVLVGNLLQVGGIVVGLAGAAAVGYGVFMVVGE